MTDVRPVGRRESEVKRRSVVGCVLTRNEERSIARAVTSLQRVADPVVVVDSCSDDRTVEIARALGAEVLTRQFDTFPRQRNWALEQIEKRFGDVLVLSIDADEWLSDELVAELTERRAGLDIDADVYLLKLRRRFDGRVLRHGGFGRTWLARLMPAGRYPYEGRDVNERLAIPDGARVGRLEGWLEHDDVANWEDYVDKHNRYSTLEAEARVALLREGGGVRWSQVRRNPTLLNRWLRERVWNRAPARPALRFVQVYVVMAGWRDGRAGFRRAVFEAWQEMMTDLKAEKLFDAESAGAEVGR